jgi:hypothetical protein
VKVTIAGADVTGSYNADQLARTSVALSAYDLEIGLGAVVVPDTAGSHNFQSGRQCKIEHGVTLLSDGFLASSDVTRAPTPTKPGREWTISVEDANAITANRRGLNWTRPTETCTARILARISADGLTVDTTWVQSTSASLPAKKYKTGDIWSELATDAIERTGWTLFVHDKATGGRCFHFHALNTGHTAGLSISDVIADVDYSTVFMPIGPRQIVDPADLRNDIRLEDQAGRIATVSDSTSIAAHDADGRHHQDYIQVDADSQADLDLQAARMLLDRKADVVTWSATIGPLDEAALALIRPGDMMTVTSQAMGLTAASRRIAQMTLSPAEGRIDRWSAALELSRPVRHGNKIPGLDAGGREGGRSVGGGGNSDPAFNPCNDCPPFESQCVERFSNGTSTSLGQSTLGGAGLWVNGPAPGNSHGISGLGAGGTFTIEDEPAIGPPRTAPFSTVNIPGLSFPIEVRYRLFIADHDIDIPAVGVTGTVQFLNGSNGNVVSMTLQTDHGSLVFGGTNQAFFNGGGPFAGWANAAITVHLLLDGTRTRINAYKTSEPAGWMVDTPAVGGVPEKIKVSAIGSPVGNSVTFSGLMFLQGLACAAPSGGQPILNEHVSGVDGTSTTFSTIYGAYLPGSLHVRVNGMELGPSDIASQDPTTGSWTFAHPPKADSDVTIDYRVA